MISIKDTLVSDHETKDDIRYLDTLQNFENIGTEDDIEHILGIIFCEFSSGLYNGHLRNYSDVKLRILKHIMLITGSMAEIKRKGDEMNLSDLRGRA